MGLKAEALGPLRLTAGAGIEVASIGFDDAGIALCQLLEAGVAVALGKALLCRPATVGTGNGSRPAQLQGVAQTLIEIQPMLTGPQRILHRPARLSRLDPHLAQAALYRRCDINQSTLSHATHPSPILPTREAHRRHCWRCRRYAAVDSQPAALQARCSRVRNESPPPGRARSALVSACVHRAICAELPPA